ncbi:MAG: hypothetical protein HMLKMBBP_00069 [Planctomycetes bacterium]|nr:hypothetical protein [Planctomycetota bacterium]
MRDPHEFLRSLAMAPGVAAVTTVVCRSSGRAVVLLMCSIGIESSFARLSARRQQ